ncbi:hypothetical protein [Lysinibacillus fusiformis]|uniref:hypothetical protein n=1 Tax=Lysinibacillus fusiformis TaxID=28031 RepID=UPI001EF641A1|nr:hypothetical protein [Lysinibacillus fusiformis]MCG7435529.1 hypothetical protein [Lysinibacillus fusiformis]
MSKKLQFSIKELVTLLGLTVFVSLVVFLCINIAYNYLDKSSDIASALIGAGGNFSGGVLGGIVAYVVAAYQIKNSTKFEDVKLSRKISSLLLLIKAELNHNMKLISNCKEDFASGNNLELLNTITIDAWLNNADKLGEKVSIELIESLINCTAVISTYKSTTDVREEDLSNGVIQKIKDNIQKIELEITNLKA